ncbi:MAG: hypothetical protein QOG38_2649 [Hyphomicrobiales bacterium]|jgi:hypothetical protein|nr:hypothetical protein [Hyphomicrobiales bacterium]
MKLYLLYLVMLSIALFAHLGARQATETDVSPV